MAAKTASVDATPPAGATAPSAAAPATGGKPAHKTRPAAARKTAARKTAAAPRAKPKVQPAAAPEASPAKAGKKPVKPRPALVRDSFTMPETDFALLATLKSTALGERRAAKKSELLRAGLRLLAGLEAPALVAALDRLEPVKTGRPKKGH